VGSAADADATERGTLEPLTSARRADIVRTTTPTNWRSGVDQDKPDATLAEVIEADRKPGHPGTVSRTLKRMNLPRKKSRRKPPSKVVQM